MSIHFSGVYKLQGPTHLVERRIDQLERNSQESFDAPAVALVQLDTDDIYSASVTEAQCKAMVLTGQDSRNFCKPLGLEFPKFSYTDRHHLINTFSENPLLSLDTPVGLLKFRLLMHAQPLLEPRVLSSLKKAETYADAKLRLHQLCQTQGPLDKPMGPLEKVFSSLWSIFQQPGKLLSRSTQAATVVPEEDSIEQRLTDFYEAFCKSEAGRRVEHEIYGADTNTDHSGHRMNSHKEAQKRGRAMYYYDGRSYFQIDPDAQLLPDSFSWDDLKDRTKHSSAGN